MSIMLRDYNSYYDGKHILVKSRFELTYEDIQADLLSLIKKQYIQQHMFFRDNTSQNNIPMFMYEKLDPSDLSIYHTKEELFSFLNEFFLVTWDCFEAYSKEDNQDFLNKILYPQLEKSNEYYVINADKINTEKKNEFGNIVYDYFLLLMWKNSLESFNIALIFSD